MYIIFIIIILLLFVTLIAEEGCQRASQNVWNKNFVNLNFFSAESQVFINLRVKLTS